MAEKSNIEDIFRSALEHHEEAVRPELWSGIQASLANTAASAGASAGAGAASAGLGKVAAVIGMAALVTGATISEVRYHQEENAQKAVSSTEQVNTPEQNITQKEAAQEVATFDNQAPTSQKTEAVKPEQIQSSTAKTEVIETRPEQVAELPVSSEERATADQDSEMAISDESSSESKETPAETANISRNESSQSAAELKASMKDVAEQADEPEENQIVVNSAEEESADDEPKKTTAYFTHEASQLITPNGDPYNEYFQVKGFDVDEFFIRIMTQGGTKVFESTDINFRWNGKDRLGNALPAGVYYYEIQATGTDGLPYLEKNAKGNVTVVRD